MQILLQVVCLRRHFYFFFVQEEDKVEYLFTDYYAGHGGEEFQQIAGYAEKRLNRLE